MVRGFTTNWRDRLFAKRPLRIEDIYEDDDDDEEVVVEEEEDPFLLLAGCQSSEDLTPITEARLEAHKASIGLSYSAPEPETPESDKFTEAETMPSHLQWETTPSEAINQWRHNAAPRPRFRREASFHAADGLRVEVQILREETPQESERQRTRPTTSSSSRRAGGGSGGSSHRSKDEPSSSDDSSSKRPRDLANDLKYIIRKYLRAFRGSASYTDDRRKELPDNETFIPCPKITFLIDQPQNLVCQICQQTVLKMGITAEKPGADMPAIMACGHAACHSCLGQWLEEHDSCPFCRKEMRHDSCGHKVEPKLVAHDTIHSLPPTLASGGRIGDRCFECLQRDHKSAAVKNMLSYADRFKDARLKAEKDASPENLESLKKAQDLFERTPEDLHWTLTRMKQRNW